MKNQVLKHFGAESLDPNNKSNNRVGIKNVPLYIFSNDRRHSNNVWNIIHLQKQTSAQINADNVINKLDI